MSTDSKKFLGDDITLHPQIFNLQISINEHWIVRFCWNSVRGCIIYRSAESTQ